MTEVGRGRDVGPRGHPDRQPADASPRLLAELRSADVIAAEDTRRLCSAARSAGCDHRCPGRVLLRGQRGAANGVCWSMSSRPAAGAAGDRRRDAVGVRPGYRLVAAAIERGFPVTAVPGPSAVLVRWPCPGCRSTGSASRGSCPARAGSARGDWPSWPASHARWSSSRRRTVRRPTLTAMAECFGADRRAAVCRELTKTHEEVRRGPLPSWSPGPSQRGTRRGRPRRGRRGSRCGRPVVWRGGGAGAGRGGTRLKQAVTTVAQASGLAKNLLYEEALKRPPTSRRGVSGPCSTCHLVPVMARFREAAKVDTVTCRSCRSRCPRRWSTRTATWT